MPWSFFEWPQWPLSSRLCCVRQKVTQAPPICNGPGREICYDLLISSESTLYIVAPLCIIILYILYIILYILIYMWIMRERERKSFVCICMCLICWWALSIWQRLPQMKPAVLMARGPSSLAQRVQSMTWWYMVIWENSESSQLTWAELQFSD